MSKTQSVASRLRRREHAVAFLAGLAACLLALSAAALATHLRPLEASRTFEAMMPTARFFAFAMLSGAATVLVLMLTLFSLSFGSPARLRRSHYIRIKNLAAVDTIALIGSTLFMLMLIMSVPMKESQSLPPQLAEILYYLVVGFTAVLGGLITGVMVMLYQTLRDIIRQIGLEEPMGLLVDEDEE